MSDSRNAASPASNAAPRSAESGPAAAQRLAELRAELADVDRALVEKLNQRTALAREQLRLGARESAAEVVAPLLDAGAAFPQHALPAVYCEILSGIRSLESPCVVAFLGPKGTFSHQAALEVFGSQIELEPAGSLSEVFAFVERGRAGVGIVPVENSTTGAVTETLDSLVESELSISGEFYLPANQNLLSRSGRLGDIRRVVSHPQGLAQCREWLQRNLPHAHIVEATSTAAAAQMAADDDASAAVGSEVAAEVYGLEIVEAAIEDRRGNTTRFAVVGREQPEATGNDLTSAVFTVHKDQSGTLFRLLEPFARHGISLTNIQSRPMKGKPWEYLFFVDLVGHTQDEEVAKALAEAIEIAYSHKILGSYPRVQEPVAATGAR